MSGDHQIVNNSTAMEQVDLDEEMDMQSASVIANTTEAPKIDQIEEAMNDLGFNQRDESTSDFKETSHEEGRKQSIERCIKSLLHACRCQNEQCRQTSCMKMKRVVAHTKICKRKTNGGCPICKQFIALCCYHAKHCIGVKCSMPLCSTIKRKLEQQLAQRSEGNTEPCTSGSSVNVVNVASQNNKQAMQKLMSALKDARQANKDQNQILSMLKSNSQLMTAFIKFRQFKQNGNGCGSNLQGNRSFGRIVKRKNVNISEALVAHREHCKDANCPTCLLLIEAYEKLKESDQK